ncbi:MAG: DUF2249 domain-containing protein [Micropruina sp.]|nr:MAG: DUF2249 domain-containing protein [Micropruina sp.]
MRRRRPGGPQPAGHGPAQGDSPRGSRGRPDESPQRESSGADRPHDPKPLLAALAAAAPDQFAVEYLDNGPDEWRLQFTRTS